MALSVTLAFGASNCNISQTFPYDFQFSTRVKSIVPTGCRQSQSGNNTKPLVKVITTHLEPVFPILRPLQPYLPMPTDSTRPSPVTPPAAPPRGGAWSSWRPGHVTRGGQGDDPLPAHPGQRVFTGR